MQEDALSGGFNSPSTDSAQAFRGIMEAMAYPGRLKDIWGATPPAPLSKAAGTLLLTLCDAETPVYLAGEADCDAVRAWVAFHTGAPVSDPTQCMFAVGTWAALAPLSSYPIGTAEYPDRAATLIIECPELTTSGAILTGPGIKTSTGLSLPDVDAFQANHALYPLGLDFFFTSDTRIAALPRSSRVLHTQSEATAQEGVF